MIVDRAVDCDCGFLSRKGPFERAQPLATRMRFEVDTFERFDVVAFKLGQCTEAAIGILPDEERLVHRVQRVHLELVVRVLSSDETFHVVVVVNRIVAIRVLRLYQRFFDPIGEVEILIVPKHRRLRVMNRRLPSDDVHKMGRARRSFPCRLIQPPVQGDRLSDPISGIPGNLVFRARKLPWRCLSGNGQQEYEVYRFWTEFRRALKHAEWSFEQIFLGPNSAK